ncbi:MAG: PQQ-dependent sugar dehydrogenase [Anaerolineae bacterium]|nr:PQQ-dependent sugar dehydrogenase [Anaerolineae bacterium]
MKRVFIALFWLCLGGFGLMSPRPAAAEIKLPEGFVAEVIAADFDQPTAFDFLPDGRILVAERAGMVKVVKDRLIYAQPMIDLRHEVNTGGLDRGLIDVAVDPKFVVNGYIYLLYIYDAPQQKPDADEPRNGRLVRYTVVGDAVDPDSALVLLDDYVCETRNHGVGSIRFAPNGAMFVSLGDGAISEQKTELSYSAQDLNVLNGKIIRIDPATGAGIGPKWGGATEAGNPLYDSANPKSARSRIWSWGYRNPFRMGVHPVTGVPIVGDVGWNSIESLQQATAGSNMGWPCYEGDQLRPEYQKHPICERLKPSDVTPPFYAYSHAGANASLTGGAFNPGGNLPDAMTGDYFFADYSKQFIKRASLDSNGKFKVVAGFGEGMGEPVDLKFSPDGRLFYLSIFSGGLRQIRNVSATVSAAIFPEISCQRTPCVAYDGTILGEAPFTITLNFASVFSQTYLENSSFQSFLVNFGDGSATISVTKAAMLVRHVYAKKGDYALQVRGMPLTSLAQRRVTVGSAKPVVEIKSLSNWMQVKGGESLSLVATARDVFGRPLPDAPVYWWVNVVTPAGKTALPDVIGAKSTLVLPSNLPDNAQIEVMCAVLGPNYHVGVSQLTLLSRLQDGYIRTWWLSRGYPNLKIDEAALDNETNFSLAIGDKRFSLIRSLSQNIDLKNYLTPNEETFTQATHIAYAWVWVESPDERKALIGMNSDESLAVWLNQKEVWRNRVNRPFPDDFRDIDLPAVTLKKGLNQLLVKIAQTNASNATWGFKLRLLNADGSQMSDVRPIIYPMDALSQNNR